MQGHFVPLFAPDKTGLILNLQFSESGPTVFFISGHGITYGGNTRAF